MTASAYNRETVAHQPPKRILVTGTSPYWNRVGVSWLRSNGFESDLLDGRPHGPVLRWLLTGRWKQADLFYLICTTGNWLVMLLLCIIQKPCVLHWIGSDVLSFLSGKSSKGWRRMILGWFLQRRGRVVHLADSPELTEELKQAGISSSVVRLIPDKIQAEPTALPSCHTVLSYWTEDRKDFYQGDLVIQLAKEFPDTPFVILGTTGKGLSVPSNLTFLGRRDDIETIYRDVSVLIRMPRHDSLGMMVVEMLARGRYVLYNKPFAHCYTVATFEEARQALSEIFQKTEPNREGAWYVQEHFSPEKEAQKLAEVFQSLSSICCRKDPE